jgi:hypothetical protein
MGVRWWRQVVGRSLLRERAGRRLRAIGACPSCGEVLSVLSEGWFDADHVMTEHLLICAPRRVTIPDPVEPRRLSQALRLA